MSTTVEEIYTRTIRPLPAGDQLELASIILDGVVHKDRPRKTGDITKFFGKHKGGARNDSDNDRIDADLARAYADDVEDQD
jgi:hypothetical protein